MNQKELNDIINHYDKLVREIWNNKVKGRSIVRTSSIQQKDGYYEEILDYFTDLKNDLNSTKKINPPSYKNIKKWQNILLSATLYDYRHRNEQIARVIGQCEYFIRLPQRRPKKQLTVEQYISKKDYSHVPSMVLEHVKKMTLRNAKIILSAYEGLRK